LRLIYYRISPEKRKYLEEILHNDINYSTEFVNKVFLYWNQIRSEVLILEFFKNLDKIYYGLGKKIFEETLLPNLLDWTSNGNSNIIYEFLKAIGTLPVKSNLISGSIKCYDMINKNWDIKELTPFLNPVISLFILNQKENIKEEKEETKQETTGEEKELNLYSNPSLLDIKNLTASDLEPFIKPGISRDLYDYFSNSRNYIKKAKLETLNTIIFLFNFFTEDYELQPEDIKKIEVSKTH